MRAQVSHLFLSLKNFSINFILEFFEWGFYGFFMKKVFWILWTIFDAVWENLIGFMEFLDCIFVKLYTWISKFSRNWGALNIFWGVWRLNFLENLGKFLILRRLESISYYFHVEFEFRGWIFGYILGYTLCLIPYTLRYRNHPK